MQSLTDVTRKKLHAHKVQKRGKCNSHIRTCFVRNPVHATTNENLKDATPTASATFMGATTAGWKVEQKEKKKMVTTLGVMMHYSIIILNFHSTSYFTQ